MQPIICTACVDAVSFDQSMVLTSKGHLFDLRHLTYLFSSGTTATEEAIYENI